MKTKIILLVICLVLLLVFQAKVVIPFVQDIASSDLFMEDTGDDSNLISTNTNMTDAAFNQCNNYIANEIFPEMSITFSETPLNAFSLGAFQYLVNADLEVIPNDAPSHSKRYACRIKYLNNDDLSEMTDSNNWSIEGISGLDEN